MKIVGFTDISYVPIAKKWYHRLIDLGYKAGEIEIVCHDQKSVQALQQPDANISSNSIATQIIPNPDRQHMVRGFWKQLMMKRLQ